MIKIIKKIKQTEEKGAERSSPSRSISTSLVDAVRALQQNAVLTSTELKGKVPQVVVTYPPELLSAMRGLFKASRTYDFEIHVSVSLATIAGGVFNTSVSWNPAAVTFSEWSALAALFDEVTLRRCQMDLTSAFGPTSTGIIFQVAVAADHDASSGATPTFTTVQRLAESELIHPYLLGNHPGYFRKLAHPRRPYALTGTPGGAAGTPSGCLGQWDFASNIVGTATINYMFLAMKNVVRLRNRA